MARLPGAFTRTKAVKDDRSKAWKAMHVLRTFTIPQLSMTSGIGRDNAKHYIYRLQAHGFVRKVKGNCSGVAGSHSTWLLVRHTGPEAPIAMRDGRVYDPNTDTIHGELQ